MDLAFDVVDLVLVSTKSPEITQVPAAESERRTTPSYSPRFGRFTNAPAAPMEPPGSRVSSEEPAAVTAASASLG
jgi:hypothetical protein